MKRTPGEKEPKTCFPGFLPFKHCLRIFNKTFYLEVQDIPYKQDGTR